MKEQSKDIPGQFQQGVTERRTNVRIEIKAFQEEESRLARTKSRGIFVCNSWRSDRRGLARARASRRRRKRRRIVPCRAAQTGPSRSFTNFVLQYINVRQELVSGAIASTCFSYFSWALRPLPISLLLSFSLFLILLFGSISFSVSSLLDQAP